MTHRLARIAVASLALAFGARAAIAQSSVDLLRGVITGADSKKPLENVNVSVLSASTQITRGTTTKKDGTFTLAFPDGGGDYWITITLVGYVQRRYEVRRNADEEALNADARLTPLVTKLAPVITNANRPRAPRNDNSGDIGSVVRSVDLSSISPDQATNLAALAATLPGLTFVPGTDGGADGFSAFGLDPSLNSTLINGADANGLTPTADGINNVSVTTSVWDVSQGRVVGGTVGGSRIGTGSNIGHRRITTNGNFPDLQWTDAIGRANGSQYSNLQFNGSVDGPIKLDKSFYTLTTTLSRKWSPLHDIFNEGPDVLRAGGLSSDSVSKFLAALGPLGVPLGVGGVPGSNLTQQAGAQAFLNFNPPGPNTTQYFSLSFLGNLSDNATFPRSPSLPDHASHGQGAGYLFTARHTAYPGFLAIENNASFSQNTTHTIPYLVGPSGSVLITSTFPGATSGVAQPAFGGTGSGTFQNTSTVGSASNLLRFFSSNGKHLFKVRTEGYYDGVSTSSFGNEYGSFAFQSLSDLAAGKPASFRRNLTATSLALNQESGAFSIGDAYSPTTDFHLVYGIRGDINHINQSPAINADLLNQLGVRNSYVPNRAYPTARLGFTWTYGTAPTISAFQGAARIPASVLMGGVGIFQAIGNSSLISGAVNSTGLPSSAQQVSCVGSAVPTPNWASYFNDPTTIPTTCADSTIGTVFSDVVPAVQLLSSNFQQTRRLGSQLAWRGATLWNHFSTTVSAQYNHTDHVAGTVDLNFAPVVRFTLPSEAGRPVYVNSTSIVPATGSIASHDARVTQSYSSVIERTSDLEVIDREFTVQMTPILFLSGTNFGWSAFYNYQAAWDHYRGFNATTDGNPLTLQWMPASLAHHVFSFSPHWTIDNLVTLSTQVSLRSGVPYTPTVVGDINGDGFSDDRAFVFPTSDATVGAAMDTLLSSTSASARRCLESQVGAIAGVGSCSGPWTVSLTNVNIRFNSTKVRINHRASLQLSIQNPIVAADLLVHGGNPHGWGTVLAPSPQLLYVRGFDPSSNRYTYSVNQRFGSTSLSNTLSRGLAQVTLSLTYNLGKPQEEQQLFIQLDRGRSLPGQKASEGMMKSQVQSLGTIYNAMSTILSKADSLGLTTKQADSISTLNRWYTTRADSIWTPVAQYLAELPLGYDQKAAYDHYRIARETIVDLLIKIAPDINGVLTAEQKRKLPALALNNITVSYLQNIRSDTITPGS